MSGFDSVGGGGPFAAVADVPGVVVALGRLTVAAGLFEGS